MFKMMASFSLTRARNQVCHWWTTLSITLCETHDVMATHHLQFIQNTKYHLHYARYYWCWYTSV